MLYNIATERYLTAIPHEQEFHIWRGRLTQSDLNRIQDALADMFDSAEIRTSSWLPGKDWTDTAWAPIYDTACLGDEDLAARCFGLFVWEAAIQHPLVWAFGRYEKDGIPIEGLTYFRIEAFPPPPDDALALVRKRLTSSPFKTAIFHLAFPIHDVEATLRFYVDGLGCTVGRRSKHAITLGLAGHQLVAHLVPDQPSKQKGIYPSHFGLVFLSQEDWQALADKAKAKGLTFYQQPRVRFPGTRIEHRTFFLEDPSHNLLEFKHYTHESAIFGEQDFTEVGDTGGESTD